MRALVLLMVVACSGDPDGVRPDPDAYPFQQGPLWFRGLAADAANVSFTSTGSVSFTVNIWMRPRMDSDVEVYVTRVTAGGIGAFLPHPRFGVLDLVTEQPRSLGYASERVLNLMPDETRDYPGPSWLVFLPKYEYTASTILFVVDGVGPFDPAAPTSDVP